MAAYYNEIDPFAAEWLKELMKGDVIADGEIDNRSIEDVTPSDLAGFTQCHFFAGIGVWSYALRQAGWPDDRPVWTGSCPCQPFSAAGKGNGFADERHLWPAFHWLIEQCRPVTVFGEQVASKDGLAWLDLVSADMEGAGYTIGAIDSCAAGFGAPHIRQRLYWVADAEVQRRQPQQNFTPTGIQRKAIQQAWAVNGFGNLCAVPRGMADAKRNEKHKEQQRSAEDEGRRGANGISGRGLVGGLADTCGKGFSERICDGGIPLRESGADERKALAMGRASTCGVADASCQRRQQDPGSTSSDETAHGGAGRNRGKSHGNHIFAGNGEDRYPRPTNGFWRDADWLLCRDGKWRPTQSEIFPLAHGATNRVGILRGAGNAIVAPQAKAFIEAAMRITTR